MVALSLSPFTFADADTLPPIQRRGQPRVRVEGSACYLSSSRILIARVADVSLTGAFVATNQPDPIGTVAALRLERNKEYIVAEVTVCRVNFASLPDGTGVGMGLAFGELTPAQRRFLARYVAACQHEQDL